jgi:hypothetical protein
MICVFVQSNTDNQYLDLVKIKISFLCIKMFFNTKNTYLIR